MESTSRQNITHLVVERGPCQDHGDLIRPLRFVPPSVRRVIPNVSATRESNNAIGELSPHFVAAEKVRLLEFSIRNLCYLPTQSPVRLQSASRCRHQLLESLPFRSRHTDRNDWKVYSLVSG